MSKSRITAKKYTGDDAYSWAVFIDGRPLVTGLVKSEVPYYKRLAQKRLDARENNQPSLREQKYAEEVAAGQHDGCDS